MTVYPPDHPADLSPLPTADPDPAWPVGDWVEGEPGHGVDGDRLTALLDEAFADPQPEAEMGLSLACVVIHRGRLIAERYGPTAGPDEALTSWSMAKSFTQAAVGLLVYAGRLDLHRPAPVPEWSDPSDRRHAITLDQLLRMSSGLEFNEDYIDEATSHCLEMLWGDGHTDMGAYAAGQALLHPPDTVFNYSSGTTNIISRIIADEVGRGDDYLAWLQRELFDPIAMTADARLDSSGVFVGSSYVYATARDFARFGLLYLRDGVWDGLRLLPPGWVDYARTPRGEDPDGMPYGAHWWVPQPGVFAAHGYEGQRIICVPEADAVIVRLGKTGIDLAPQLAAWLTRLIDCFDRNGP